MLHYGRERFAREPYAIAMQAAVIRDALVLDLGHIDKAQRAQEIVLDGRIPHSVSFLIPRDRSSCFSSGTFSLLINIGQAFACSPVRKTCYLRCCSLDARLPGPLLDVGP